MFFRNPNPLLPRMEHVAKQYGDYVTMATFGAWAEATGQHGLREHLARIFHDINEDSTRALQMLPRLAKDWNASMDTRFDRYLPWAAREFNRMFKPYKRIAKREGLPAFPPGYDVASRTMVRLHPELDPYVRELGALATDTRDLQNRFRAIVDWAEDEGIDLNKYDWFDAAAESERWAEQRKLEDIPQGRIVYRFGDGWTIQQLSRQEQLDAESNIMQHCLEEYTGGDPVTSVDGRDVWIYSLRDPTGAPHATMEWDLEDSYVSQLRGKQNDVPKPDYLERIVGFRLEYLDPDAEQIGVVAVDDPDGYDIFGRTPLLGSYSARKTPGGKPGPLLLVYAEWAPGNAEVFSVMAIDKAMGSLQEEFDRRWLLIQEPPHEMTYEEGLRWEEEEQGKAWNDMLSGVDVTQVAPGAEAPRSLHWLVWRDHQVVLEDNEDEMVNWLAEGGWSPACRFLGQRAANKARLLALP